MLRSGRQRRVWRLSIVLAALAAPAGAAPTACPSTEIGSVVVARDGLQVVEPAAQGLAADDVLEQLNSQRLRTCADLSEALREARERGLALLFLVLRDQESSAVVALPPAVAAVAATATPVAEATPTPVTVSPKDSGAVGDMLSRLLEFGHTLQTNLPVLTAQPWARRIGDLRRAYEVRQERTPALSTVEPILGYYETIAEILRYKEKAGRDTGELRPQPNAALEYHSGPPVSIWMRRYPFLGESVVQLPRRSIIGGESNGLWSPDKAVELLVAHALADGERVRQRLAAEPVRG